MKISFSYRVWVRIISCVLTASLLVFQIPRKGEGAQDKNPGRFTLASDSAFRRAQVLSGGRLDFSDILALKAILLAMDDIVGTPGTAQRKKIHDLNAALASSRLKVSSIVRTVRVGPKEESARVITIYLDGNPWKEAYLGWEKLSIKALRAIGMRSTHAAWFAQPETRRVFIAASQ